MLKDVPEQKLKPEFEKYAGKIVNLKELDILRAAPVEKTWLQKLGHVLSAPARAWRDAKESFAPKPAMNSAKFYITKEAQAVYVAAHPNGDIIPNSPHAPTRGASYAEVSQLLNVVSSYAGPSSLTKEFMAAIDAAPDHRAELGNLVQSGYGISVGTQSREAQFTAVPLNGMASYASFRRMIRH